MKIDDKILGSVKMTFWKSNTIIIGKDQHAVFSSKYFIIETNDTPTIFIFYIIIYLLIKCKKLEIL